LKPVGFPLPGGRVCPKIRHAWNPWFRKSSGDESKPNESPGSPIKIAGNRMARTPKTF